MVLKMIFITTLDKPAEGSPIDGADGADPPLWQVVEFNCWLLTLPCTFCPGLKKVLGEKASHQQYGQNERKSPLLPLLARHTAYVMPIYLPKVEPARAYSIQRPIQLSHWKTRQNKQRLLISCLSPED